MKIDNDPSLVDTELSQRPRNTLIPAGLQIGGKEALKPSRPPLQQLRPTIDDGSACSHIMMQQIAPVQREDGTPEIP